MAELGKCQPTAAQKLRLLPAIVWGCGVPATKRILTWFGDWGSCDPATQHWHLGPVGVDVHLQGKGIGSRMMAAWCARRVTLDPCPAMER